MIDLKSVLKKESVCADEDEEGKFTLNMVVREGICQEVSSRLRLEG